VFVAALERCGGNQECVDRNNLVAENYYCRQAVPGYNWFYSYGSPGAIGSHVSAWSGTTRGVFGGAGQGAGHGAGGGE